MPAHQWAKLEAEGKTAHLYVPRTEDGRPKRLPLHTLLIQPRALAGGLKRLAHIPEVFLLPA